MINRTGLAFLLLLFSFRAMGRITLLPESLHQQFQSFGQFTGESTALVYRSDGRPVLSVGGVFPILEDKTLPGAPQFVAWANIQDVHRFSGDYDLSETMDARVAFLIEASLKSDFRVSLGLLHYSGHVVDGVNDLDLLPPNLSIDMITLRLVRDIEKILRFALTLKPVFHSDPATKWVAADQCVEWFPFAGSDSVEKPSPFLAFGMDEFGRGQIDVAYHVQMGLSFGNHFSARHQMGMRTVLGYYHGPDPRLKYAFFKSSKSDFAYLGLLVDI